MTKGAGVRRLNVLTVLSVSVWLGVATVAVRGPAPSASRAAQHPPTAVLTAGPGPSWTVYHGDGIGSGVAPSGMSISAAPAFAWASPQLTGQVYGEPLESGGRVFVATEDNWVYALDASTGAIVWQTNVGTPVAASSLPCGDISPSVGITGTPVIDESRAEIFVVADESSAGSISHHLVGLGTASGNVVLDQVVDPPGSTPAAQLQRTGLNLSTGNVVFGLGGNAGDCGSYHGWVIAVPEGGGPQSAFEVDSAAGEREGAIWMGGAAPEVDSSGNVWVSAGNGSVEGSGACSSAGYDYGDSVLELNPQMGLLQYFAPSNWCNQNAGDQDLGSAAPAILSNGRVLQVGKSQTGYLLNQAALGGIGGQVATAPVCSGNDSDGGDAVSGTDVFIPCGGGLEKIQTTTSGLSVAWTAHNSSGQHIAGGPPILAGGEVWSIGGNTLYEIDPATGSELGSFALGGEANHFPTPSAGDGLLLAPGTNQVYAFAASPGAPAAAAFQANTGSLWTWAGAVGSTGYGYPAGLGMAPGTSPSITPLGNGEDAVAFQANTGSLWTWVGAPGTTGYGYPTGLGTAPGTSPTITSLGNGRVAVAFQANTGSLWTWVGAPGTTGYGYPASLGMRTGTSPSITSLGNGETAVAFQAYPLGLWTWVGVPGTTGYGHPANLGMPAGSSPTITPLGNGAAAVAFEASGPNDTGAGLWTWTGAPGTTGYGYPTSLGMEAGTSPSITSAGNGAASVAFQADTGGLWTWTGAPGTTGYGHPTSLGMAAGTSPTITVVAGGAAVAFQANTGSLWTWGGTPGSTGYGYPAGLGMRSGTSPGAAAG